MLTLRQSVTSRTSGKSEHVLNPTWYSSPFPFTRTAFVFHRGSDKAKFIFMFITFHMCALGSNQPRNLKCVDMIRIF